MGIPRFFKLPRTKGFNYKPLYYDAEKEDREQRKREIAKQMGLTEIGDYIPSIRHGSMRSHSRSRMKFQRTSNIRLIIIIFVLSTLVYLILFR